MDDLRLAWSHLTYDGRVCGLQLLAFAIGVCPLLMLAVALFLALEPTR